MTERKTFLISIASLPSYLLGTYGADNSRTPNLDTLAAHGLVLDRLYAESTNRQQGLECLLTGRPALAPHQVEATQKRFSRASMVTDCAATASMAESHGFADATLTESGRVTEPASDSMQCCVLAPWIAAAEAIGDNIFGASDCDTLWLHSLGLDAPWDAPIELREQFADPEDPPPPNEVEPPTIVVDRDTDPDLLIGWTQVASAQAAVLDIGLGIVLSALEIASVECEIVFVALGGYPLGEHGAIGRTRALAAEPDHKHALLRETSLHLAGVGASFPSPKQPGTRSPDIVQLSTIGQHLQQWLDGTGQHPMLGSQSLLTASHEHQFALATTDTPDAPGIGRLSYWARTPAWSCFIDGGHEELYAMPDDKWETNDIASRMISAVDAIREEADARMAAMQGGQPGSTEPLDDLLTNLNR